MGADAWHRTGQGSSHFLITRHGYVQENSKLYAGRLQEKFDTWNCGGALRGMQQMQEIIKEISGFN